MQIVGWKERKFVQISVYPCSIDSNIGITESTTTIEYPHSKRKVVKDSQGQYH